MERLALFMLTMVTTVEFFTAGDHWHRFGFLPKYCAYIPELLGVMAAAYVVFVGVSTRYRNVRAAYWFAFSAVAFLFVCGALANHVEPGPIFAGVRNYLRAVPWFFVPAVFAFTDKNIKKQLTLLLGICLMQLPFAIEQRIKTGNSSLGFVAVTGDWTSGTLMQSPTLTIVMVGGICISAAFYLRKQLPLKRFLLLAFLMLIPTTINETKVTVIILPLALLVTFWCAAEPNKRGRQLFFAITLLLAFGAVFVPVYDAMMEGRQYGQTLGDFFLNEENTNRYLSTGKGVGAIGEVGRLDSIEVPLRELAKDPITLAFGYGLGNATNSALGTAFSGAYFVLYKPFLITGFARILLELGVVGLFLTLIVHLLIFRDCLVVARHGTGIRKPLAAGWAGVTAVMAVTIPYVDNLVMTSLMFVFWYISGVIAAERMRLSLAATEARDQAVTRHAYTQQPALQNNAMLRKHDA
jgi:hypothetical protein